MNDSSGGVDAKVGKCLLVSGERSFHALHRRECLLVQMTEKILKRWCRCVVHGDGLCSIRSLAEAQQPLKWLSSTRESGLVPPPENSKRQRAELFRAVLRT